MGISFCQPKNLVLLFFLINFKNKKFLINLRRTINQIGQRGEDKSKFMQSWEFKIFTVMDFGNSMAISGGIDKLIYFPLILILPAKILN
jgi:hypothetical protein